MNNTLLIGTGALIAFIITWLSGYFMIPWLHKIKFGQPIKEIGPTWHEKKRGTPTMGGLMFILAAIVALIVTMIATGGANDTYGSAEAVESVNLKLICGLVMALFFTFCGFLDDYAKVSKQNNAGISGWQKIFLQTLTAVAYLSTMELLGLSDTLLWVPYAGWFDIGFWYYPLMIVLIVGTVNAVNIHDGIDGLSSTTTAISSAAFLVIFSVLHAFGGQVWAAIILGCCLGFLIHNHNPAKVFMGDLGNHFLGGAIITMAFYLGKPLLLIPIGIVYYIDMLSVVLQVASFKLTGKRIFKMSPIHHSYEMSGWSENKIVLLFSVIGLVGAVVGVVLAING
ncbi:MAG TPA: phospho-N-acetylmuramoyl-pentapeptide-transferase [Oscillospiraceae bacterium]|nr:phospho-N-acetylmuramoyl-pentapeptide-transferase [Oscillospiraceae bacterium]HPF56447.1 phospho-N-acetylmuramoyl-pentapeptide-transferase [Clostridiales bacterium]HPK35876.1 phospho-N-acetylmuramoyl-pentapeptide-transferase [Oscillospiraceae bacterium]HPR76353.1 phospho-N-acetylmuramoyl-pentapeptide-transferase [Oscillospiraceae bacterium]